MSRPGSVTTIGVLVYIVAVVQVIAAAAALTLLFAGGEEQLLYGARVSDWYWLFSAILSFILALCYFWLGRAVLTANPAAWAVVNVLAIINIVFGLLNLAYGVGLAAILINALVLVLNNTGAARTWFQQA